jgi:hypothetical protein
MTELRDSDTDTEIGNDIEPAVALPHERRGPFGRLYHGETAVAGGGGLDCQRSCCSSASAR